MRIDFRNFVSALNDCILCVDEFGDEHIIYGELPKEPYGLDEGRELYAAYATMYGSLSVGS